MGIRVMRKTKKQVDGLKDLCRFIPDEASMIEIGCYAGESAKVWLDSGKISKLYCVDAWTLVKNKNKHYDKSVMIKVEGLFDSRTQGRGVIKKKGYSKDILPELIEEGVKVDVVYIDGEHTYEAVKSDIQHSLKLLNPNGIIAGHDLFHHGAGKAIIEQLGFVDVSFADGSWLKHISRLSK